MCLGYSEGGRDSFEKEKEEEQEAKQKSELSGYGQGGKEDNIFLERKSWSIFLWTFCDQL